MRKSSIPRVAALRPASAALAAALWLAGFAQGQTLDEPAGPPSVTVNAETVITAKPDLAQIDIGIVTRAPGAPEAARQNAEKVSRVIGVLGKMLAGADQIETVGYALRPNYHVPKGGEPRIDGYVASNTLRVKTGNLDEVGRLIDAAMNAGANNIDRLLFTLKDEEKAQIEALRASARKARTKADETAAALGLTVVRVLRLVESERHGFQPVARMHTEAMAAPGTPIEAGTVEVRSSVTLTVEIAPLGGGGGRVAGRR